MKRIENNPQHPSRCFKDYSIIDFASRTSQQNVMSKYINGITLKELFFFGFQETFSQDIQELRKILNWKDIIIPNKLNNSTYKAKNRYLITNEVIKQLEKFNSEDIKLYNKALELKNKKKYD